MYAAEWAWYARWQGQSPTVLMTSDAFPDVASLRRAWVEHEAKMRAYVDILGEDGITRVIDYKLSRPPDRKR